MSINNKYIIGEIHERIICIDEIASAKKNDTYVRHKQYGIEIEMKGTGNKHILFYKNINNRDKDYTELYYSGWRNK